MCLKGSVGTELNNYTFAPLASTDRSTSSIAGGISSRSIFTFSQRLLQLIDYYRHVVIESTPELCISNYILNK
ncbi:unnamed protein product [Rotaria socialis]|uniref:Uncharacterized protein n=2 Tax=Rotaria socialis TaxID=392032 RepID=A0A820WCS4_9BILA|nr:unnamed protein product [Rotaria socialis]